MRQGELGSEIIGIVVDPADGRPIPRAVVTLREGASRAAMSADTDASGSFRFSQVSSGLYSLAATKPGYPKTEFGATRAGRPGTPIAVRAGTTLRPFRVVLPRGGVVSGRVSFADGRAVRWGGVTLLVPSLDPFRGTTRLLPVMSPDDDRLSLGARTDSDGEYRLAGVPEGRYILRASGSSGPGVSDVIQWTYHRNTVNPDTAEIVSVAAGAESVVDLTLVETARGVIEGETAQMASGLDVFLTPSGPFRNRAAIPAPNRFLFEQVVPGRYRLEARARGSDPHGQAVWAEAEVVVGADLPARPTLELRESLMLTGRVVTSSVSASSAPYVEVVLEPLPPWQRQSPLSVHAAPGAAFALGGVAPGWYRFTARVPQSSDGTRRWRIAELIWEGRDVLDDNVKVDGTGTDRNMIVRLTDRDQGLTGVLVDAAGRPDPAPTVLVFSTESRYWTIASRRICWTRPTTEGVFAFPGLPAGDYYLVGLTDPDPDAIRTPVFLESIAVSAMRLTLAPGEMKHLTVRSSQPGR